MKDLSILEFSEQLASSEPTPGGGAAAGVSAALGVSAIIMAMRFSTSGKKLTAEDKETLEKRLAELEPKRVRMLDLIEADAKGFEPLAAAFSMSKNSESEVSSRNEALAKGYLAALAAPVALIDTIVEVLDVVEQALPYIKKTIISDIGVGTQLLNASAKSSILNVLINTESMNDRQMASEIAQTNNDKLDSIQSRIEKLYEEVQNKIQN